MRAMMACMATEAAFWAGLMSGLGSAARDYEDRLRDLEMAEMDLAACQG